jgi:hypothetical protein
MKILEARFHPPAGAGRDYIVVGRVIVEIEGDTTVTQIKPACSLGRHGAPATILATLRHLARMTAPDPWARLQLLKSRHWSFVPLEPVVASVNRDADRGDPHETALV